MRRNLALLTVLFALHAQAATIEAPLPDAAQEDQARAIFRELRCVVCEGQSLAESDAVLAVQMRAHIRTMVGQGDSTKTIERYFEQRYGPRILMTPPLELETWGLWGLPFALLALGAWIVWRMTRPKGSQ